MTGGRSVQLSVRLLWERKQQDRPAARLGLTLDRVVAAGIDLADREGLDALSMTRVAQELGFTTAALYRHVAGKDELLMLMQDAAWQPPEQFDLPAGGWRPSLEHWCQLMRAVLRRHPWLRRLRFDDLLGGPSQLAWMELGLRALAGTPVGDQRKGQILLALNGHVFADALIAADLRSTARQDRRVEAARLAAYREVIESFADPGAFPALHAALAGGLLGQPGQSPQLLADATFTLGLDLLLDGIGSLIANTAAES